MHYDVKIYKTQEDYDNYNRTHYIDGFTSAKGAIREGKLWLVDHEVVVVLSSDDEFIQVLKRDETS